jgi:thiol-disulfide isomerase/thioredoxin
MKSPLLASLLLVNFYLTTATEKNPQPVTKKQKAFKRVLAKKIQPVTGVTVLTSSNLTSTLAGELTIVLVGSDWCKWCSLMTPIFEESNKEFHKTATHALLSLGNYFDDPASLLKQVQKEYGLQPINTIPAFLIFKKGKLVEHISGSQTKEQLAALIKKHTEKEPAKSLEK